MPTSLRLDPAVEQRLDRLSRLTGRTKAYYLRELVASGLDDLEDYYLAAATIGARPQRRGAGLFGRRGEERPWPGRLTAPSRPDEN